MKLGFKNMPWNSDASEKNRFVRMDGSSFGSKGMARFLTSPTAVGWFASNAAIAFAVTMFLPEGIQGIGSCLNVLVKTAILNCPAVAVGLLHFNYTLPVSKNTLLDKRGLMPVDLTAKIKMENHYKEVAWDWLFATALIPIGLKVNGAPLVAAEFFAGMVGAGTLPISACSLYARRKIRRNDWVVTAEPPPKRREVRNVVKAPVFALR